MEHPTLMPGAEVRDGNLTGKVVGRLTTRTDAGPQREITVRLNDGREVVYVNDDINNLHVL